MPYLRATWAGKWDYVPLEAPRMFSETGPVAEQAGAMVPDATRCLSSLNNGVLALQGGHGLAFGKPSDPKQKQILGHEEFLGLSVVESSDGAVQLALDDAEDGDVVAVLWPSGRLMPARVRVSGWRRSVELPAAPPDGERFFVLDEDGRTLITVGMPSGGIGSGKILPRLAMVSWLVSIKSPAAARAATRFVVEERVGYIVADDTVTGATYKIGAIGKNEIDDVKWSLAIGGLAGVVGRYDVGVRKCQG